MEDVTGDLAGSTVLDPLSYSRSIARWKRNFRGRWQGSGLDWGLLLSLRLAAAVRHIGDVLRVMDEVDTDQLRLQETWDLLLQMMVRLHSTPLPASLSIFH